MPKTNLQDRFLSQLHNGQIAVTVITINGYQLKGQIAAWDQFTLLVECGGRQHLVYKSAVSTIVEGSDG